MDYLLDPFVLAIPSAGLGPAEADDYVEDLMAWMTEIKRKQHKFWLSYPIVDALEAAGQYPSTENFRRLALSYGQREAAGLANTMLRACEPDLLTPPYLDDALANGTVACDERASVILPAEVEDRLSPPVAEALRDTLSNLAVSSQCHQNELAQNIRFASRLTHFPECKKIILDGRALDINTDQEEDLHAEWSIVLKPEELDEEEKEEEYLKSHWRDVLQTIRWMYNNWCESGEINPVEYPLPMIFVGKAFVNSIQENHFENYPNILEDIFKNTILALTGVKERSADFFTDHHPFNETNNSKSPQRVRTKDDATAWRVYITRYKPQVRMHYWLLDDGSVELSKVGPHDDFTIR